MQESFTSTELAAHLGISDRAVRQRAVAEGWKTLTRPVRGGYQRVFLPGLLPSCVRSALLKAASKSPAASAAAERADGLMTEVEVAAAKRLEACENSLTAFYALPAERQREAEAKRELLKARDAFIAAARLPKKSGTFDFIRELTAGTINLPGWIISAAATRQGRVSLSWPTLNRWEKAHQTGGIAALAAQYSAHDKTTSVPGHMQQFIIGMRVEHPHAGIPKIMKGLEARFCGQDLPTESAVRRFVKKWNAANHNLVLYLTNPDEWKNRHLFAVGSASESIIRLNQLWEMDSTPADIMLIDGRHTVIGVIDVFSRRMKLLVSPTSKAVAVAALIRRAIIDWGVPEIIKTDNGADYVSKHIVRVLEELEIAQALCKPFTPEEKPHIERALGTFSHDIVELLPGYIGHSVADRQAIRARQTFASRMMSSDQTVDIKMTAAELQRLCDRWTAAMYHQDAHAGLGGKTPAQMARAWMGPVRRIEHEAALDLLLAPAPSDGGMRVIGKKGIAVEGGNYFAPEMAGHEGDRVLVLLDATDWGMVRCYLVGDDGSKIYLCAAIDPERAGVDRQEVAARMKAVQRRVIREASAEVKRVAKEAATREIHREILNHRESEIAKIAEFRRPAEDYTTPALEEAMLAVDDTRRREAGPQPIGISDREERQARAVIDLAGQRCERLLPSNDWERYEQLDADLRVGMDLSDADMAFMKRYEIYLETGERQAQ
ncbi:MAG: DDE-type integrase/transposase/recombinase [Pseudomonadota bacterium]